MLLEKRERSKERHESPRGKVYSLKIFNFGKKDTVKLFLQSQRLENKKKSDLI